jgi:signal transduction histidine kinase
VNVESNGFGLYIVKNIVEAHKGKVWGESDGAGKGSRFIVELPA